MRTWRESITTQTHIHVAEVACDRCGESAKVVGATNHAAWGEVEVLEQGAEDVIQLDLCRDCSEALVDWLKQHPRARVRRRSDAIREMDKAVRLSA